MKRIFYFSWFLLIIHNFSFAQNQKQNTYCNPIDINYRYNFEQINDSISYRSGADPVIVIQNGEYYLFVTISGGYWHSNDLLHWKYIEPNRWPMEDICAPAALSVRDTLYLFQSTFTQRPIFYSTHPETGKLEFFNRWLPLLPDSMGPWDPDIFYDSDLNKWYMYFGSSNVYPIYGVELNHAKGLSYVSRPQGLISLHPDIHGWERFGKNHMDPRKPFIEGAWMTKYHGKYYLQYAAPGTEFNVYANGTYIGDHPLGPFTYAPYNPISYKPGGFMTGAGHGNTFQDKYGNYWNTGTPWIAVNWNFERRISMFPAGFDNEDQMHVNTRFGDFPHYIPGKKIPGNEDLFTGWMLLSYKKPTTSSSVKDTFYSANVTDENPRTFWVAKTNNSGEWLSIDLKKEYTVKAIQINFTDYKSNLYSNDRNKVFIQSKVYSSTDGKNWDIIFDNSEIKEDHPNHYIELNTPVKARYIRYENIYVPTPNLAICAVRIFGNGDGDKPDTPANLKVVRHEDERNATITWNKVDGVTGYNILWGIAKDKLYQTYQVFADERNKLELRALNVGQKYYFAIEAFDENGVSPQSDVVGIN